jgi:hypothetical protein
MRADERGWVAIASLALATALLSQSKDSGQSVTGAYEGWFRNPDGTYSLLLGYYNRNLKEVLEIPVGPNNRIEPGGPDQGQPTVFLPRRQWGVFTVTVPADFGARKLTWTLVANGQTTVIPASLNPLWELSPLKEEGIGNTPPTIRFEEHGAAGQGPRPLTVSRAATVGNPLELTVWATDDAKTVANPRTLRTPPVTLTWSKFRGPGAVSFANEKPAVSDGKASTTATFSVPGEYLLRVVANDWSGDGGRGFQCCWTNGMVKVTVR